MDFHGDGDGGGFAPSNGFGGGRGGGGGGGSQDSGQKRVKRNYDEQTIIPVTLSMILKAKTSSSSMDHGGANSDNAGLVLDDGRSLNTVKVVAAVRSVEDQSTNVMYVLEDGTGSIDVKQWLDDNDPSALTDMRHHTARDGVYIKVIGQVKEYEGRKQIVANAVRPLTSGNELTHHLLEVVYSSEKYTRDTSIVPPMMTMAQPSAGHNLSSNNGMGMGMGVGMGMGMGGGPSSSSVKDRLMDVFHQYSGDSEEGISIGECIQYLPDVPEAEIRAVITHMSEEGDIYSTISESHFRLAH